jgi:hypothetical protein
MPIDHESLERKVKMEEGLSTDLSLLQNEHDKTAREIDGWHKVKATASTPGWALLQKAYRNQEREIHEKLAGDKRISTASLLELRGRLHVLGDVLGLDKQADSELALLVSKLDRLEKAISVARQAKETVRENPNWLKRSLDFLKEKAGS